MDSRIPLISAVARLLDLHQTSHGRGVPAKIIVPPKQPNSSAGFFLSVGLAIIDGIYNLEIERGPGYQSSSKVKEYVAKRISKVTDDDIDYCIRFLSQSREIHCLVENENDEEIKTRITDTALVEKAGEFSQIRLTENARLLLRIEESKGSWLYKDKDVEKIAVAIERGHFNDIGRFCKDIITSLSELGLHITQLEERPTLVTKRQEFSANHIHYSETISKAQQAITKAIALTTIEPVREKFREWAGHNGMEYDMGFILTELERVAKTIEAINRKLMRFVQEVQGGASSTAGIIKFQDIAYRIAMDSKENEKISAYVGTLVPMPMKRSLFHPFDFVGSAELVSEQREEENISYFIDERSGHAHSHLNSFIERNISVILQMLEKGPISFSTLINRLGFTLEPGETVADFAGIYTLTENSDKYAIKVGIDGKRFETRIENLVIHGNNTMIGLCKEDIYEAV